MPGAKKYTWEKVGSIGTDRGYLLKENNKEVDGEPQGAEGLNKNCTKRMPLLTRLVRGFCNIYH